MSVHSLQDWHEKGFVHLRGALQPDLVASLVKDVDELSGCWKAVYAEDEDVDQSTFGGPHERVFNAVAALPALAALTDHPSVLGPLIHLVGENLQVLGSELFRRGSGGTALVPFHTDGGRYLQAVQLSPTSTELQVKVQFFLTDVNQQDNGNFVVIPGSHRRKPEASGRYGVIQQAPDGASTAPYLSQAQQILARAGDAVIFSCQLWHAVAANHSGRVRKSAIIRYGPLWMRPVDYIRQPPEMLNRLTPRQRRLFGDFDPGSSLWEYYEPTGQSELMNLPADKAASRA